MLITVLGDYKMRNIKKIIILLILFFICFPVFSLELSEGLVKLVLHENIGRFSLYYLKDFQNNTYLPLFFDQDPRTSVLTVVLDNRIYRLGETSTFDEVLEETNNGARFVWTSTTLIITQDFSFISSNNTSLADGIKIKISIKNITNRTVEAGLRFLIDTYLGEDISRHFVTNNSTNIKFENTYLKTNMCDYIISPESDETNSNGLQLITSGSGATVPDSVIIANWSRLNDSSWYYETSSTRNFNLMPYSINDSAVALYYDPVSISPSGTKEITILLGNANPEGFNALNETSTKEIADLLNETRETNNITNVLLAAQADLITLENLITQIDNKLKSGNITDSDLLIIEQIISELKKKYPQD
jgi:hypothetical protein